MNLSRRLAFVLCVLSTVVAASMRASAVGQLDSVQVLQTPNGTYGACFDFSVRNRQNDSNTKISEFRLRIISGRAAFQPGFTTSPSNWAVLSQTGTVLRWTSNLASADIAPGQTRQYYSVCVQDTGVMRVVWETRNLDSIVSSDTLVLAGRRPNCDDAFFRVQPSQTRNVVDVDVVAGNGALRKINWFTVHPVTPGVTISTAPTTTPAGWVRLKAKPDTVVFFTQTKALDYNQFAEGFRLELENVPADSTILLEWWTAEFGDQICFDTVALRFGISPRDSLVRIGAVRDLGTMCCVDLKATNAHAPASTIDALTMKLATTGARIDSLPRLPFGWTARAVGTDSMVITKSGGFASGDTVTLAQLCMSNAGATGDTIAWRWYTFGGGLPITSSTGFILCLRPFVAIDSVVAAVDSTFPSPNRCIGLTLRNRNSRRDVINGFSLRISNPGLRRAVLSASAPSPWRVAAAGGDSVVFTGGLLQPGGAVGPFNICVTLGDTSTRDPLSIAWSTSHRPGTVCGDTLRVNAILSIVGDSLAWREVASPNASECCFRVRFLNRHTKGRTLDHMLLTIEGGQSIFNSASVPAPWTFVPGALPSFDLTFLGDTIPPGGESPEFQVCLDMQQFPTRPATVPVVFRTFAGAVMTGVDSARLVCSGESACDTVLLRGVLPVAPFDRCLFMFGLNNSYLPAAPIDALEFRITSGPGAFAEASTIGAAATWSVDERTDSLVRFRGPAVPSGGSLDTFGLIVRNISAVSQATVTTWSGNTALCASVHVLACGGAGVAVMLESSGFRMEEPAPNPARNTVLVAYELLHAGNVAVTLRDLRGAEVLRLDRGREAAGEHSVTLSLAGVPAGTYYCTVRVGEEFTSRKLVVVR